MRTHSTVAMTLCCLAGMPALPDLAAMAAAHSETPTYASRGADTGTVLQAGLPTLDERGFEAAEEDVARAQAAYPGVDVRALSDVVVVRLRSGSGERFPDGLRIAAVRVVKRCFPKRERAEAGSSARRRFSGRGLVVT